jgi:Rnl2 family RNA ligase
MGLGEQEWVVLEKIDGSNYSFWTDGRVVKVAKRSGWISDDDVFFNHRSISEAYRDKILEMHAEFCKEGDILTVTGELYGGKKIQKRIHYQDDMKFSAFDISVNSEKKNHHDFIKWTETIGIPTVPVLGMFLTFDEALQFNPVFESLISVSKDKAEGVVIKLVIPHRFPSGESAILKIKNPEFSETAARRNPSQAKEIRAENQPLLDRLMLEITESRLTSVRSKLGELSEENFKRAQGLLIQDALKEYHSKNDEKAQSNKQWKLIQQKLMEAAAKLLRELPEFRL